MKEKIISKAIDFFLKLGFKNITMGKIASEMCISKKIIYKYFDNKELFISESTIIVYKAVHESIEAIVAKNYNAIEENFEIKKRFQELFTAVNSSPINQLKKHYPDIYIALLSKEVHDCNRLFIQNIEKGIQQELYRKDLNAKDYVSFYYTLIFGINGRTSIEKELNKLEFEALEYHTRSMATTKGIIELEKQIQHSTI